MADWHTKTRETRKVLIHVYLPKSCFDNILWEATPVEKKKISNNNSNFYVYLFLYGLFCFVLFLFLTVKFFLS